MSPEVVAEIRFCSECGQPRSLDDLAHFGDTLICANCKNRYEQKLREGVAPNYAIVCHVQYCGFWIRFVAAIIDGIIVGVFNSIVQFVLLKPLMLGTQMQGDPTPAAAMAALGMAGILALIGMAFNALYEGFFIGKLGATPGKMALGMKVVRSDGSRVGYGRAFGRYFAKILSYLILLIGYLMAAWDSEKRALHDMICDTRVIKQAN
jgi:uncharacterized RDD family membrane protein YckC